MAPERKAAYKKGFIEYLKGNGTVIIMSLTLLWSIYHQGIGPEIHRYNVLFDSLNHVVTAFPDIERRVDKTEKILFANHLTLKGK